MASLRTKTMQVGHLERGKPLERNLPQKAFYRRLQRGKGEKIVKVATERKLLERIYHMLKERGTFQKIAEMVSYQGKPVLVTGSR